MSMYIRQTAFDAVVIDAQAFVIQPQQVQNCGVQIVDGADLVDGLVTEFVGGAVAEGAFDTRSGHPRGEAVRVVVAAVGSLLEGRHATEFRAPDHQRVFKKSPLFQVL